MHVLQSSFSNKYPSSLFLEFGSMFKALNLYFRQRVSVEIEEPALTRSYSLAGLLDCMKITVEGFAALEQRYN